MPAPATVEFAFDPAAGNGGVQVTKTGEARYLSSIQRIGGAVSNGWWRVTSGAAFGQGDLQFHLDRTDLAGDLVLVLRTDWQKDTNIAIQLYDAQGRAVALDLFGETKRNARTVGTDTFVIPLNRYPDATTISVRRLSGDLRILGGGLYPVLSELAANAENEKALAEQLGVIISPHHWMFTQSNELPSGAGGIGDVHAILPLDRTNSVGAAALNQGGYPAYRPLNADRPEPIKFSISNTTEPILTNALRMLALAANGKQAEPLHTSSDGVAEQLLKEHEPIGFMSVPLSSAEKEQFFRDNGYSITEIEFARDALQILVHSSNPINSITVPQLDAIFGTDLKAGAPKVIRDWAQLGGAAGQITAVGGWLNFGTTRTFQQLVLKGGAFRNDMVKVDVVYSSGVEKDVAGNTAAIGFATLHQRRPEVRIVPVAQNSGEASHLPNATGVYSGKYPLQRKFYCYVAARSLGESGAFEKELINLVLSDVGQTLVARAGTLPLTAGEVVAQRAKLRLP